MLELIVAKRLARGLTTVIDSTGLDAKRRAGWRALAAKHAIPAFAVAFDTPPADVRARNRARDAPVPAGVVAAQLRAVAALTLEDEGFAAVYRPGPVSLVPPPLLTALDSAARQREDPVMLDFGLQISRFGFPGHPATTAQTLAEIARAAEETGFTSLWVMDHFLQIPQVGREWEDMLESYTTLGYLAGVTERIRLGTLVTGITYRNLAHLAKIVATLDVLSGGRALCGLGAAWFEREHELYGWDFKPRAERYALLEDALELLPLMWGKGTPRFEGRTLTVAGGDLLPAAAAGAHPDPRRRLRRAQDAAPRRPPRRRVQPVRRSRHRAPQGRRPARALRDRAARPVAGHGHAPRRRARRGAGGRTRGAGRGDRLRARRALPRACAKPACGRRSSGSPTPAGRTPCAPSPR